MERHDPGLAAGHGDLLPRQVGGWHSALSAAFLEGILAKRMRAFGLLACLLGIYPEETLRQLPKTYHQRCSSPYYLKTAKKHAKIFIVAISGCLRYSLDPFPKLLAGNEYSSYNEETLPTQTIH